jgi:hypothetical protein
MKNLISFVVLVVILSVIALIPLAIVWSLNTLFSLGIPYSFWSWLAVVILNLTWLSKPNFTNLKPTNNK